LKIACVRRFRHFQLLVSLFERLSPSLVVIICETFASSRLRGNPSTRLRSRSTLNFDHSLQNT